MKAMSKGEVEEGEEIVHGSLYGDENGFWALGSRRWLQKIKKRALKLKALPGLGRKGFWIERSRGRDL